MTSIKNRLAKKVISFLAATLLVSAAGALAQESSMRVAIEQAKKYAGTTIVVPWEAGLQIQAPKAIVPQWEKKTGMKVKLVGMDYNALHDKQIAEFLAGSKGYDVVTITNVFMGDFVTAGLMIPLDPYIDKYMNKEDLKDIVPLYRKSLMSFEGTYYGLGDDGDTFLLYYRKDLFNDPQNQMEFESQYGYELKPPETWEEFQDVGTFFTDKYAPELYGAVIQRAPGQAYSWFVGQFFSNGGRFFDPETMEPKINAPAGIKTLRQMVEQNKFMAPGIETFDFMDTLNTWLAGKAAMVITWPPYGRWAEGYGTQTKQLAWVPKTQIAGKVGYRTMPGSRTTMAGGFSLGVSSQSDKKEATYLFLQWWTSPEISLQVVMLPFALRDPWRISHFESPLYRSAWDNASEYLDTLQEATQEAALELGMAGGQEYMRALDHAITLAFGGESVEKALNKAAQEWAKITDRLGKQAQKEVYHKWLQLPGAGPAK